TADHAQILQDLLLQRAPDVIAVPRGLPRHHHPYPLLPDKYLRPVQQLLELRQPETLPDTIRLMRPQKIADSLGNLQPSTQLGLHTTSSPLSLRSPSPERRGGQGVRTGTASGSVPELENLPTPARN